MDRIHLRRPILYVILMLGIAWIGGCASTGTSTTGDAGSEDVADIDELLGLTDDATSGDTKSDAIAEDDVLRLLGVTEESQTSAKPADTKDETSALKSEVQDLEAQQRAMQTKERDLRSQIDQQQETLSSAQRERDRTTGETRDASGTIPESVSFQDRYQEARQDYTNRRYRDAIQKFEELLSMNNKHSLSDNCQYWIGEAYCGLANYRQAIVAFEKVFTFPRSNKDADAQLKLGICYLRLGDQDRSKREFQKLINNYPNSEYISAARRYLEQME